MLSSSSESSPAVLHLPGENANTSTVASVHPIQYSQAGSKQNNWTHVQPNCSVIEGVMVSDNPLTYTKHSSTGGSMQSHMPVLVNSSLQTSTRLHDYIPLIDNGPPPLFPISAPPVISVHSYVSGTDLAAIDMPPDITSDTYTDTTSKQTFLDNGSQPTNENVDLYDAGETEEIDDIRRQMEELDREIVRKQNEQEEMRRKKLELLQKAKQAKSLSESKQSSTSSNISKKALEKVKKEDKSADDDVQEKPEVMCKQEEDLDALTLDIENEDKVIESYNNAEKLSNDQEPEEVATSVIIKTEHEEEFVKTDENKMGTNESDLDDVLDLSPMKTSGQTYTSLYNNSGTQKDKETDKVAQNCDKEILNQNMYSLDTCDNLSGTKYDLASNSDSSSIDIDIAGTSMQGSESTMVDTGVALDNTDSVEGKQSKVKVDIDLEHQVIECESNSFSLACLDSNQSNEGKVRIASVELVVCEPSRAQDISKSTEGLLDLSYSMKDNPFENKNETDSGYNQNTAQSETKIMFEDDSDDDENKLVIDLTNETENTHHKQPVLEEVQTFTKEHGETYTSSSSSNTPGECKLRDTGERAQNVTYDYEQSKDEADEPEKAQDLTNESLKPQSTKSAHFSNERTIDNETEDITNLDGDKTNKTLQELQNEAIRKIQEKEKEILKQIQKERKLLEGKQKVHQSKDVSDNQLQAESVTNQKRNVNNKNTARPQRNSLHTDSTEIKRAHTKSPARKAPRIMKHKRAHLQNVSTKAILIQMEKEVRQVPSYIQQSCPFLNKDIEVEDNMKDKNKLAKQSCLNIQPAHNQKPFGIAGQLIVQNKRKRSKSSTKSALASPMFLSLPNTPSTSPTKSISGLGPENKRSRSSLASTELTGYIDTSANNHENVPNSPFRAHRPFMSALGINNISTTRYMPPPTYENVQVSSDCRNEIMDLTTYSDPAGVVDMEKKIQLELNEAIARRQSLELEFAARSDNKLPLELEPPAKPKDRRRLRAISPKEIERRTIHGIRRRQKLRAGCFNNDNEMGAEMTDNLAVQNGGNVQRRSRTKKTRLRADSGQQLKKNHSQTLTSLPIPQTASTLQAVPHQMHQHIQRREQLYPQPQLMPLPHFQQFAQLPVQPLDPKQQFYNVLQNQQQMLDEGQSHQQNQTVSHQRQLSLQPQLFENQNQGQGQPYQQVMTMPSTQQHPRQLQLNERPQEQAKLKNIQMLPHEQLQRQSQFLHGQQQLLQLSTFLHGQQQMHKGQPQQNKRPLSPQGQYQHLSGKPQYNDSNQRLPGQQQPHFLPPSSQGQPTRMLQVDVGQQQQQQHAPLGPQSQQPYMPQVDVVHLQQQQQQHIQLAPQGQVQRQPPRMPLTDIGQPQQQQQQQHVPLAPQGQVQRQPPRMPQIDVGQPEQQQLHIPLAPQGQIQIQHQSMGPQKQQLHVPLVPQGQPQRQQQVHGNQYHLQGQLQQYSMIPSPQGQQHHQRTPPTSLGQPQQYLTPFPEQRKRAQSPQQFMTQSSIGQFIQTKSPHEALSYLPQGQFQQQIPVQPSQGQQFHQVPESPHQLQLPSQYQSLAPSSQLQSQNYREQLQQPRLQLSSQTQSPRWPHVLPQGQSQAQQLQQQTTQVHVYNPAFKSGLSPLNQVGQFPNPCK